jgi:hypothetical protein
MVTSMLFNTLISEIINPAAPDPAKSACLTWLSLTCTRR